MSVGACTDKSERSAIFINDLSIGYGYPEGSLTLAAISDVLYSPRTQYLVAVHKEVVKGGCHYSSHYISSVGIANEYSVPSGNFITTRTAFTKMDSNGLCHLVMDYFSSGIFVSLGIEILIAIDFFSASLQNLV